MNHSYLMHHVSYHLHTIVRRYSPDFKLQSRFCGRLDFDDKPMGNQIMPLFTELSDNAGIPVTPTLLSVNGQVVYALVPAKTHLYIIGPVKFRTTVYLAYQTETVPFQEEWTKTVPFCEFTALTTDMLLIYNLSHQDTIDENTLLLLNCINPDTEKEFRKHFSDSVFENREEGKVHNPYDQEKREFSSIEQGELEQLKRSLKEDYTGEIGTLANSPLRNAKNLGIVIITLASRAAIRGGLLAEVAFSLSDSYIQKIEALNDVPSIHHLFRSAEFEYAQMVKDLKEQKAGFQTKGVNYHINHCKDYIFSHLHDRIYVQDIAEKLGLNANYLSDLFHRCENISLTDFILNEKIKLVKNLLVYSHYSYSEIATYIGFSSQSHLGKQFKKITGMTLRKYREAYGMKEFFAS